MQTLTIRGKTKTELRIAFCGTFDKAITEFYVECDSVVIKFSP